MQKRILLIDDEASLRRSISLGLNQRGIDVDLSENGMTALKKIDLYKKNDVNLDTVIVDIQLPDIDGIKLGKIIKSKYPNTSMIFITGYADKLEEAEIEDLKIDAFLQKPFDADELTAEIEKSLLKHPERKEEKVSEKIKTVSSYALIKVDPKKDFFEIYKKIYYMENVLYCDATRGDIDIVVLIQSDSLLNCKNIFDTQIKIIDGISEAEFLIVDIPVLSESIKDIINTAGISLSDEFSSLGTVRDSRHSVCSYVLVEVEREKLEDIYPVLKLTENVIYCDFISGKYNLIMMVSGTQFSQIDKFIENKLINMNGVLKVKEYPIINIYEM